MTKVSVAIATGPHPFPFRTRKLSLSAPMVLGWIRPGRVGRRRISRTSGPTSVGSLVVFRPGFPYAGTACRLSGPWALADLGAVARLSPCPRVLPLRRALRPSRCQPARRRADRRRADLSTWRVGRLVLRRRRPRPRGWRPAVGRTAPDGRPWRRMPARQMAQLARCRAKLGPFRRAARCGFRALRWWRLVEGVVPAARRPWGRAATREVQMGVGPVQVQARWHRLEEAWRFVGRPRRRVPRAGRARHLKAARRSGRGPQATEGHARSRPV